MISLLGKVLKRSKFFNEFCLAFSMLLFGLFVIRELKLISSLIQAKGAVKLLDCANKEGEEETGEVDDAEDEADDIDDESEHDEIRLHA